MCVLMLEKTNRSVIQTAALLPHLGVLDRPQRTDEGCKCVGVWSKLRAENDLAATQVHQPFLFFPFLFFCSVYASASVWRSIKCIPSFLLGPGNGLSHSPSTQNTPRGQGHRSSCRQMAAALSSGRGGHGHCPEERQQRKGPSGVKHQPDRFHVSFLSARAMLSKTPATCYFPV